MSFVSEQHAFLCDVVKLINYSREQGYVLTFGEAWRPLEMQQIYVKTGRSKTLKSQHLNRMAIDFNVFKDGKPLASREEIRQLGDYWESLSEKNRWGGNWRGLVDSGRSKFIDCPHFERII